MKSAKCLYFSSEWPSVLRRRPKGPPVYTPRMSSKERGGGASLPFIRSGEGRRSTYAEVPFGMARTYLGPLVGGVTARSIVSKN
jgi:hypothetical protein